MEEPLKEGGEKAQKRVKGIRPIAGFVDGGKERDGEGRKGSSLKGLIWGWRKSSRKGKATADRLFYKVRKWNAGTCQKGGVPLWRKRG